MVASDVILGILLLCVGRKLFWLAVGITGFLVGANYAASFFPTANQWTVLALAVGFGVLGALCAVFFEWVAIILVGFLGGGYFLMNIFPFLAGGSQASLILFLVGGAVGVVIMVLSFDLSLILISSLIGAMLIIQHLNLEETLRLAVFVAITVIGVMVQYPSLEPKNQGDKHD
jgi:hypothetical protein